MNPAGSEPPLTTDPSPLVRDALASDMPAIQAIYEHHVLHGLATFEEIPPSAEEMAARWANLRKLGLPYLVAEVEGRVAGYSYASSYRPRAAYRYTLEDSVYVAHELGGRGIGTALLTVLIARLEAGPWRQLLAVIGDSGNASSIALHRRFGFRMTGTNKAVGFKFGGWVDTVEMQRELGPGATTAPR